MSSDPSNQLNVPSDAPTEVYRTPNVNPVFDTESKDVSMGNSGGQPTVNSPGSVGVTIGAVGAPVSNGGS
jgi:hypothetical protein